MRPEIDEVAALLVEAAETTVLPSFRQLADHEIREKEGPSDLVTAADLACEAFLTERLAAMLPDAAILGEEAAAHDPGLLGLIESDGYVWVIDPIDGTYNFANGDERFGIIVALVRGGDCVAGWIHQPIRGVTLVAEAGAGAFLGGERLHVAAPGALGAMTAALYVGAKRSPALHARLKELRPQLGPRSFARCVAEEYIGLVEARIHYAIFTRQLPWDHAAGCLIHREAGGYERYLNGRPYDVAGGVASPLMLAPDEDSWSELRALFTAPAGVA